ncbi:unnamed protein product, partial [Coregonus sp. 'balchen']
PTLVSTDIGAVITKVQRLFEAPTDYITFSSIHGWLSEAKAVANRNEVPPKCPDQLVISSELLRTIIVILKQIVVRFLEKLSPPASNGNILPFGQAALHAGSDNR